MEVTLDDFPFQDFFKAQWPGNSRYLSRQEDNITVFTLIVLTQGPIEMDFWNGDEIAPVIEPEGPVLGESSLNPLLVKRSSCTVKEQDNPFEFFDPFGDDDSVDDTPEEHTENGGDLDSKSIFLDYGDQLVEQPKKVFSAPLQYAKTAKRVDVKKLKENIWKELTSQAVVFSFLFF